MKESELVKRLDVKRPYLTAVIIFMVFTCLLPFQVGATWIGSEMDILGHPDAGGVLRFAYWWIIRCIPSLLFIVICYADFLSQINALVRTLVILLAVSIVFIPVYWIVMFFVIIEIIAKVA